MLTTYILVVFLVRGGGEPEVETAMYRTMGACRERAAMLAAVPPADIGLDALGAVCVTSPKYRDSRS